MLNQIWWLVDFPLILLGASSQLVGRLELQLYTTSLYRPRVPPRTLLIASSLGHKLLGWLTIFHIFPWFSYAPVAPGTPWVRTVASAFSPFPRQIPAMLKNPWRAGISGSRPCRCRPWRQLGEMGCAGENLGEKHIKNLSLWLIYG